MTAIIQNSHLTGDLKAELLDSSRLRVQVRRPFGKPVRFTVDVACVDPALPTVTSSRLMLLGAITFVLAALGLFSLYCVVTGTMLPPALSRTLALLALPGALATGFLLRIRLLKRVMVRTRCAHLPLFSIPMLRAMRGDIEVFVALLRLHAGEAESKRHLTSEQLRSGEIKTLRRLAREKVIPTPVYENAKLAILKG